MMTGRTRLIATAMLAFLALAANRKTGHSEEYRISGPFVHENLAVYMVHGASVAGPVPMTLQEAADKKVVHVTETKNVNELTVENSGDNEVFISVRRDRSGGPPRPCDGSQSRPAAAFGPDSDRRVLRGKWPLVGARHRGRSHASSRRHDGATPWSAGADPERGFGIARRGLPIERLRLHMRWPRNNHQRAFVGHGSIGPCKRKRDFAWSSPAIICNSQSHRKYWATSATALGTAFSSGIGTECRVRHQRRTQVGEQASGR
jgi:hypothetical protein